MPIGQGGVSPVAGSAQGGYPQYNGVYYGVVSNNADPNKQNRALLRVPMLLGSAVTTWAISLTPQQSPPKVGALIAALFLGGDLDYPAYYIVNPTIQVESTAGNIKPIGTTSSAGTSVKLAAADHVHGNISTLSGDMQADGTAAAGASGRIADAQHVHPQPSTLTVTNLDVTSTLQASVIEPLTTLFTPSGIPFDSAPTPSINNVSGTADDSDINFNFASLVGALQAAGVFH